MSIEEAPLLYWQRGFLLMSAMPTKKAVTFVAL